MFVGSSAPFYSIPFVDSVMNSFTLFILVIPAFIQFLGSSFTSCVQLHGKKELLLPSWCQYGDYAEVETEGHVVTQQIAAVFVLNKLGSAGLGSASAGK